MPVEIEKKYRLTESQRAEVLRRLAESGATFQEEAFEENTLYRGANLVLGQRALRLRRVNGRAILTYKERQSSPGPIKHQIEEETEVASADTIDAILRALGLTPALVYEKRRMIWVMGAAEIAIDELPFGLFMEIEAAPEEIEWIEKELAVVDVAAELNTYPLLAYRHGKAVGGIVESRFEAP